MIFEAIRNSEIPDLKRVFDNLFIGIVVIDIREETITYINETMYSILGTYENEFFKEGLKAAFDKIGFIPNVVKYGFSRSIFLPIRAMDGFIKVRVQGFLLQKQQDYVVVFFCNTSECPCHQPLFLGDPDIFEKELFTRFTLSSTESKICRAIVEQKTSKEIAEERGVSSMTINTHRRNIRKKLHLGKHESLYNFLSALYYGRRADDSTYLKNT